MELCFRGNKPPWEINHVFFTYILNTNPLALFVFPLACPRYFKSRRHLLKAPTFCSKVFFLAVGTWVAAAAYLIILI